MTAGEPGTGCSVNPEAGHEYELAHRPPTAGRPPAHPSLGRRSPVAGRRIGILGSGPPALEAARIAALRGHEVSLHVGDLPLGGLLGLRAGVPGNAEFGRAILHYAHMLRRLGILSVDVPPAPSEVDVLLDGFPGPPIVPVWAVPAEESKVWLAADVLQRDLTALIGLGRRIAVIGDGALAAETALYFAGWGRRPTVVAAAAAPFADVHPLFQHELARRMEGYHVAVERGVEALDWEWAPRQARGRLLARREGKETELGPFHSVVLAFGWAPRGGLAPLPETPPPDGSTYVLGDSARADTLRDLTVYAMRLAHRL